MPEPIGLLEQIKAAGELLHTALTNTQINQNSVNKFRELGSVVLDYQPSGGIKIPLPNWLERMLHVDKEQPRLILEFKSRPFLGYLDVLEGLREILSDMVSDDLKSEIQLDKKSFKIRVDNPKAIYELMVKLGIDKKLVEKKAHYASQLDRD